MIMKHLVVGFALLTLAACGCGDDFDPNPPGPTPANPAFDLSMDIPPCELECSTAPAEYRIDVVFALDDSEFMNRANGMAAGVPSGPDPRSRSAVAQEIFRQTRARLLTKINEAKTAGLIPMNAAIDLAFAVVRYEDFGGTTVDYQSSAGLIDADARPHMLQMPLLRELHPSFSTSFEDALTAQTHGNGNPGFPLPGGQVVTFQDPQTTIESLHQIATGLGIDGDGNGDTTGNGFPGSLTATNRTFAPGGAPNASTPFVDVPRVGFVQNGQDPQDNTRPIYNVVSQSNAGVNGPGATGVIASGNEGGVGFRPDSLRWVIFASDIATVAPFRNAAGTPTDPTLDPADTGVVNATPPAGAAAIPAQAFNGVTGRFGGAGLMPVPPVGAALVAPAYAADVEATMNELVNAGIEVMALGAGGVQPGQTKPNVLPAPDANHVPAIPNPSSSDFTPFTMESAISLLTGSQLAEDTPGVPLAGGPFPAVFNLGTVGLLNAAAPNQTQVTDDLVNGLVERIRARIAANPLPPVQVCPPLPTMSVTLTLNLNEVGMTDYNRVGGGPAAIAIPVTVPVYYRDAVGPFRMVGGNRVAVPANETVPQRIQLLDDLTYTYAVAPLVAGPGPINTLSFSIVPTPNLAGETVDNAQYAAQIRQKAATFASNGSVQLQGHSTDVNNPVPNPLPRGVSFIANNPVTDYCLRFQDLTWGAAANFAEEFWGNCPSPLVLP